MWKNQRWFCQGFVAHSFSMIAGTRHLVPKTTDIGEKPCLLHLVFSMIAPSQPAVIEGINSVFVCQ